MNTRIRELMAELKKTVSTHRGAEVLIGYNEIEKFAELIVKECFTVIKDSDEFAKFEIDFIDREFKKHFGVEQ